MAKEKTLEEHKRDLRKWLEERNLELWSNDPILMGFGPPSMIDTMLTSFGHAHSFFPPRTNNPAPKHTPTKSQHGRK